MRIEFSPTLARLGLWALGAAAMGWLAPEGAAIVLLTLALVSGFWWRRFRWHGFLLFVAGLLGLAARHAASWADFKQSLTPMAALVLVLVGLHVMARGAAPRREAKRRFRG